MPTLLRRNLTCFYCGSRSAQKYAREVRQFQCANCEAVNYLDENGQITDPPPAEEPAHVQYAHSVPRPTSPGLGPSDETLFCQTCLKNQNLVAQAIAAYLPPPTDPNYATYEASYPEYKRNLERRYPQVCGNCAPRVAEKIRAAGYAAKTDNLRRIMERTKHGDLPRTVDNRGWRSSLLSLVGWLWTLSFLVQMAWHVRHLLVDAEEEQGMVPDEPMTAYACVLQLQGSTSIAPGCFSWLDSLMRPALWIGFATMWWNSKLSDKLAGVRGRLVGLKNFLLFQITIMSIRALTWRWLENPHALGIPAQAYRGVHTLSVLFFILSIAVSRSIVQIDNSPRISFADYDDPLLSEAPPATPGQPTRGHISTSTAFSSAFDTHSHTTPRPFPIKSLAPQFDPIIDTPSTILDDGLSTTDYSDTETTPSIYDDRDNAMDWTPTRANLISLQPRRGGNPTTRPLPREESPSPFYGQLPPAPLAPAHKLRNPPKRDIFRKASETQQNNFFATLMSRNKPAENDNGAGDGAAPTSTTSTTRSRTAGTLDLRPSHLQLKEDTVDTGLENMFKSVFSIDDDPPEVRRAQQEKRMRKTMAGASSAVEMTGGWIVWWALPLGLGVAAAVAGYWALGLGAVKRAS